MKLKHFDHDGRARFVTFCVHRRLPVLSNDVFRKDVINALSKVRDEAKIRLLAYVIMPEHVHMVFIPPDFVKLGPLVGEIKRLSSRAILGRLRKSNSGLLGQLVAKRDLIERHVLWQRRCYDHNIRAEESLWSKVAYCHNNPVTRGLAERPEGWIWSSYRWYKGMTDVPLELNDIAASV